MKALSIIGGGPKEKRNAFDHYPTPIEVTRALMLALKLDLSINIWEPCCADGKMSKVFEEIGHKTFSTDLRDDCTYGVGNVDFLQTDIMPPFPIHAIITNPPFNVADLIIKKATSRAQIVCMLLKSQYWHAAKRLPLFRENPPSYIMPLTWRPDFLEIGGSLMDFSWTVWIKGDTNTKYKPLKKTTESEFMDFIHFL